MHSRPHPPSRALLSSAERRSRCTGVCFACATCPSPLLPSSAGKQQLCIAFPTRPPVCCPTQLGSTLVCRVCASRPPVRGPAQVSNTHWGAPAPPVLPRAAQFRMQCRWAYMPLLPLYCSVKAPLDSAALHSLGTQPAPRNSAAHIYGRRPALWRPVQLNWRPKVARSRSIHPKEYRGTPSTFYAAFTCLTQRMQHMCVAQVSYCLKHRVQSTFPN